jgi:hypothetical protein
MAGEYVSYLMAQPAAGSCPASGFKSGPHSLWQWVIAWEPCHTFQADFLVLWGAKCASDPIFLHPLICTSYRIRLGLALVHCWLRLTRYACAAAVNSGWHPPYRKGGSPHAVLCSSLLPSQGRLKM